MDFAKRIFHQSFTIERQELIHWENQFNSKRRGVEKREFLDDLKNAFEELVARYRLDKLWLVPVYLNFIKAIRDVYAQNRKMHGFQQHLIALAREYDMAIDKLLETDVEEDVKKEVKRQQESIRFWLHPTS